MEGADRADQPRDRGGGLSSTADAWSGASYERIAEAFAPVHEGIVERLEVRPGERFLDLACGTGGVALVAARAGADVTGVDFSADQIVKAREAAEAAGLSIRYDEGDAQALPYADASFDVVATLFGAMFAPQPQRVVAEMLRVTKPGGTIAMANWTKEGFVGTMFKTFARFIAPSGMPAPVLWGDEAIVRERFGAGLSPLRMTRVIYQFRYPFPPDGVVEFFRAHYGPATRAFAALEGDDRETLRTALVNLWGSQNQAVEPGRTIVDAEYLEVIGTRA